MDNDVIIPQTWNIGLLRKNANISIKAYINTIETIFNLNIVVFLFI